MPFDAPAATQEERCLRIAALDFDAIVAKLGLVDANISRVWAPAEAWRAVRLYKNFLALHVASPRRDLPVFPSFAADEIWHHHVLDTRRYGADCDAVFGEFFHHDPYPGRFEILSREEIFRRDLVGRLLSLIEFGQALD
jgi:hypothetical protein